MVDDQDKSSSCFRAPYPEHSRDHGAGAAMKQHHRFYAELSCGYHALIKGKLQVALLSGRRHYDLYADIGVPSSVTDFTVVRWRKGHCFLRCGNDVIGPLRAGTMSAPHGGYEAWRRHRVDTPEDSS